MRRSLAPLALAVLAVLSVLAAPGGARAEPKPLVWDEVFSLKGAPRGVHLKASWLDARGRSHDLELWRDGDSRVRRRTDDKIDLLAEKKGGGDYAFHIVDLANKRLIEVSRTNLHRIGIFASFPALAGLPLRPKGAFSLRATGGPNEKTRAGECRWLSVEVASAEAQQICWSDRLKLPLIIRAKQRAGGFAAVFQVKEADVQVPGAEVFRVATAGLTVIPADQDIDPSSDL